MEDIKFSYNVGKDVSKRGSVFTPALYKARRKRVGDKLY